MVKIMHGYSASISPPWGILERLIVPNHLALILRGEQTLAYNPEFNIWHRLDDMTAEALRWLRANRPRVELAAHLEKRFRLAHGTGKPRLQQLVKWSILRRLLYLDRERKAAPVVFSKNPLATVYWICTQACNLRCTYCYQEATVARPHELSTAEAIDLIDQIVETGAKSVVFTGGEPFARRDLLEVARYARAQKLQTCIITNGHYITRQNAEEIAGIFHRITISLDHVVPEHHDSRRGKGSWKRAWDAIELLTALNVRVDVNSTLFRDGLSDLAELVQLKRKQGIGEHRIVPQFPLGRGVDYRKDELTPTELVQLNDHLDQVKRTVSEPANPVAAPAKASPKGIRRSHCGAGLSEVSVDPEGWVYPCRLLQDAPFKTKNIRDERLREIYRTDRTLQTIQSRTVERLHPCKTCIIKNDCGGGCRGIHVSFSHEHIRSYPLFCAHLRRAFEVKAWRSTGKVPAYRETGFVGELFSTTQFVPVESLVKPS